MNLNKNKNVTIIVIFLVVVFGISIFWFASNEMKKQKPSQILPEKPTTTLEQEVSTTTEEYLPSKITYNFAGIVKEKGENYILAEDRTPQPSPFVSEKTGFKRPLIKIKITPETKIGKDNKLIKIEDVKTEDNILAKFLEFNKDTNEATASDVFVLPGEKK
jgi:hypothetical protein